MDMVYKSNFSKKIYCPKCGRRVAKWDGKSTIDIVTQCRNCSKQVIYRIKTGETMAKDMPPRPASSGLRF